MGLIEIDEHFDVNSFVLPISTPTVNKNGLASREREKKVGNRVFYVSSFFLLSFFIAPMVVETGEIPEIKTDEQMHLISLQRMAFGLQEMITLIQMRHLHGLN